MMSFATEHVWRLALAAIPMALLVALICRWLPCRPSTRHVLWLSVILFLLAAPFLPAAPSSFLNPPVSPAPATTPRQFQTHAKPAPSPAVDPGARAARTDSSPDPRPRSPASAGRSRASFSIDAASQPVASVTRAEPARIADASRAASVVRPSEIMIVARDTASHAKDASAPHATRAAPTPAHTAAPAPAPTAAAPSATTASASWARLRDAVVALPPLPRVLWLGGSVLAALLLLVRILLFRRRVRSARPAPPEVRRVVARAAARLGLTNVPEARMVDGRLSPMVWCGQPPILLLPSALWAQLDEVGRGAVVCHELAHLRRRDHLVIWLDLIVGCLYWWHPVVWWARRRMDEEADLSCDTWVTALMPHARRAYAGALLATKEFTSTHRGAVPTVRLGASTNHAKRFARRLAMVMTMTNTPKRSFTGIALAASLAIGGWLVSPTVACDDKPKTKLTVEPPTPPTPPKALFAPKAPKPPKAPRAPRPDTRPSGANTFEHFMQSRGADGEEMEEQLEELEEHIEQIMEQIHKWMEQMHEEMPELTEGIHSWAEENLGDVDLSKLHEMADHFKEQAMQAYAQAMQQRANQQHEHGHGEGDGEHAHDDHDARAPKARPEPASGPAMCACIGGPGECHCPTEVRAYRLPNGKLETLTELMIRSDVPVLVSPGEDAIEVHGTPAQHHVFGTFCSLLSDEETQVPYRLSKGKLDALTALMVRPDVPILVSPGEDRITLHGNGAEQAAFRAFVRMIDPKGGGSAAAAPRPNPLAERYEDRAAADLRQMDELRKSRTELERKAEAERRAADRLRARLDRLRDKLEELRDEARDLEEEAQDRAGQSRERLSARAESTFQKAIELEQKLAAAKGELAASEERAEVFEHEADALKARLAETQEATERGRARTGVR